MSEQEKREQKLIEKIKNNLTTGKFSEDRLETDDRILARITDGIYRQPASALRELIANAYDADAEQVLIQTDAPRFSEIRVRDDGNGMSIESLARLIHHIGGSAKRIQDGVSLGIVNSKDPALTPKGRRLIGKIGIGLFSVSQLTRKFQIITKKEGNDYRLVAEVLLKTYTEDELAERSKAGTRKPVETGSVRIRAVPAKDVKSHGTEIILLELKEQTRELLQSADLWRLIDATEEQSDSDRRKPPRWHIGRVQSDEPDKMAVQSCLPWDKSDLPGARFGKLYQAIVDEIEIGESNPRLETTIDTYLRTLWILSLSAPLDYIDKHPFDLVGSDQPEIFSLQNSAHGQAAKVDLKSKERVREKLNLHAPERGTKVPFSVFVDDIQLLRPIRFENLPQTQNAIKKPLLFIGSDAPDLSGIPREDSGGPLAFEAYLLWTPKVVPKEHAGLLIRISDASGTLFDETFAKYQVAELTRLRQITAEVFVRQGLDPALNIDRESFNYSHPHYQYLMKWIHRALRQLTNTQKQIASGINKHKREVSHKRTIKAISTAVGRELESIYEKRDEEPPEVVFTDDAKNASAQRKDGTLVFDTKIVFAPYLEEKRENVNAKAVRAELEERMKAVAQVLEAYGVFDELSYEKQQQLLRAIVAIFITEGQTK